MPRKKQLRIIDAAPSFVGFKPYGCKKKSEAIVLLFEEYEAIKLADYEHLHHSKAAIAMNISRASFARIYESARKKVASALVESKEITTEQGSVIIHKTCRKCINCNTHQPPEGTCNCIKKHMNNEAI